MNSLLAKAVVSVLVSKAKKSLTSWLVAAGTGTGIAITEYPELLKHVPAGAMPWVVGAYGVALVLARHRQEITQLYTELRAELPAAIGK